MKLTETDYVFDIVSVIKSIKGYKEIIPTKNGLVMCFKVKLEDMAKFLHVETDNIAKRYCNKNGQIVTSPFVTIWVDKSCGTVDEINKTVQRKPTAMIYRPAESSRNGRAYFAFVQMNTMRIDSRIKNHFIILANESWLRTQYSDNEKQYCLQYDTHAFYHSDYYGGMGRHNIEGTIENMICTLKNDITPYSDDVLLKKCNQLKQILQEDLPLILQETHFQTLRVCVIPRAKHEEYYADNQKLFRHTIKNTINNLQGLEDGAHDIIRHTDTKTTHLARSGNGGEDPMPYCGITKDTCTISNQVRGKNILLIDDVYTHSVGIDEDAIQALYDSGAKNVLFYAIGKTILH